MKRLILLALCAGALALCGCSTIQSILGSGSAAQANTVAAAENLYTAADKTLTTAVQQKAISVSEAQNLGTVDQKVYAALVQLRQAVEAGNSAAVPALLDAFNALYGSFSSELQADGISIIVTTGAST